MLQAELGLGTGLLHPGLSRGLLLLCQHGTLLLELREALLRLLPALLAHRGDVVKDPADEAAGLVSDYGPGDAGEEREPYGENENEEERRADRAHHA